MNLKHLRYFWTVARMGGIARAAEQLNLTPQTISGQMKLLEKNLGVVLFRPAGRGLELTDAGRMVLSHTDEMLRLEEEMKSALTARKHKIVPTLRVGIMDILPKSFVYRLLASVSNPLKSMRLICREGNIDMLLADMALRRLDMVVSDRPMPHGFAVRGHNHKLGESNVAFFAAESLKLSQDAFPRCLNNAPLLMPSHNAAVRGQIDLWINEAGLTPCIMGEFDDSALMQAFGKAGVGCFPAPALLIDDICNKYKVQMIGQVNSIRETFWLITTERRISHPAINTVVKTAQDILGT